MNPHSALAPAPIKSPIDPGLETKSRRSAASNKVFDTNKLVLLCGLKFRNWGLTTLQIPVSLVQAKIFGY